MTLIPLTLKRRHFHRAVTRLGTLALLALVSAVPAGQLEFQFIGNMAFHISDGETTLLSDFPYRSGAFGYMEWKIGDVKPIRGGVALFTHFHADHFDSPRVEAMDLEVIGPPEMLENLRVTSKHAAADNQTLEVRDIKIQSFATPHRFSPEHFSYLVTWHGLRLYFPGDTESPAHMLQMKDIDVMFISPWLIRTLERQDLRLDTKVLVVYHQKVGEEIPPYQDFKRPGQGDTFRIEYEE